MEGGVSRQLPASFPRSRPGGTFTQTERTNVQQNAGGCFLARKTARGASSSDFRRNKTVPLPVALRISTSQDGRNFPMVRSKYVIYCDIEHGGIFLQDRICQKKLCQKRKHSAFAQRNTSEKKTSRQQHRKKRPRDSTDFVMPSSSSRQHADSRPWSGPQTEMSSDIGWDFQLSVLEK